MMIAAIPLLLTLVAMVFAVHFNKGELVIEAEPPYMLKINYQDPKEINVKKYREQVWADVYELEFTKKGYTKDKMVFNLKRGEVKEVHPKLEFIPTITEDDSGLVFHIPQTLKADRFGDNQAELVAKGLIAKNSTALLDFVPANTTRVWYQPVGQRFVLLVQKNNGELVPYMGSAENKKIKRVSFHFNNFAWSADGKYLAAFEEKGELTARVHIYDTATNKWSLLTEFGGFSSGSLEWSANNKDILVVPNSVLNDRYAYLLSVGSSNKKRIGKKAFVRKASFSSDGSKILLWRVSAKNLADSMSYITLADGEEHAINFNIDVDLVSWLTEEELVVATRVPVLGLSSYDKINTGGPKYKNLKNTFSDLADILSVNENNDGLLDNGFSEVVYVVNIDTGAYHEIARPSDDEQWGIMNLYTMNDGKEVYINAKTGRYIVKIRD